MTRPGVAARMLATLVVLYQRTVSPLRGPSCRFEPSCSSYAVEALRVHGALRGTALALWRLLRCQPFGTPGWDPVPERGERRGGRRSERGAAVRRDDHRHQTPIRDSGAAPALRGAGPC